MIYVYKSCVRLVRLLRNAVCKERAKVEGEKAMKEEEVCMVHWSKHRLHRSKSDTRSSDTRCIGLRLRPEWPLPGPQSQALDADAAAT